MNRTILSMGALAAGGALALHLLRRSNYNFADKVVVITGGSRGLGLELARRFAAEGARIALCARTAADVAKAGEELQRRGADVFAAICDVTDPAQIEPFIDEVVDRWGRLDVLVNNAGIIQVGPLESMTEADFRQAMDVHLWGPLRMTLEALPHMRAQNAGRIVNIASIGGKLSVPHLLPYCASKFALVGLSQGMRTELARENIWVTTISPGLMRTGSPRNAQFKGRHREEYAWFSISGAAPVISLGSGRAARRIVEACRRGSSELVFPLPIQLVARIHGLFPELTEATSRLVQRLLPEAGGMGTGSRQGKESESRWSPSWLTWLNERAAARNNEIREAKESFGGL
ncbi:MAG: SDR family oxidoreductase [Planctomycetes bacterium]|nr:SDR family oxidoreductase [Planctomycetota bacterium]